MAIKGFFPTLLPGAGATGVGVRVEEALHTHTHTHTQPREHPCQQSSRNRIDGDAHRNRTRESSVIRSECTLQTLQDPILLLPWGCFRCGGFPNPSPFAEDTQPQS
jgi:hypothetical protein